MWECVGLKMRTMERLWISTRPAHAVITIRKSLVESVFESRNLDTENRATENPGWWGEGEELVMCSFRCTSARRNVNGTKDIVCIVNRYQCRQHLLYSGVAITWSHFLQLPPNEPKTPAQKGGIEMPPTILTIWSEIPSPLPNFFSQRLLMHTIHIHISFLARHGRTGE